MEKYRGIPSKLRLILNNLDSSKVYELKEYKGKRNNKQNSKYWALLGELSSVTKIGTEELHFEMLKNYSPRCEATIPITQEIMSVKYYEFQGRKINENGELCNVYHLYKPSHELNTSEFAILLNGLIQECQQQGIDTRSYEEIMKDELFIKSMEG